MSGVPSLLDRLDIEKAVDNARRPRHTHADYLRFTLNDLRAASLVVLAKERAEDDQEETP